MLQQLGSCYLAAGEPHEAHQEFAESRLILETLGMWKTAQGAALAKQMAACECRLGEAQKELKLLEEAKSVLEDCGRLRSAEGVAVLLDLGSALLDGRQELRGSFEAGKESQERRALEVLELAEHICSLGRRPCTPDVRGEEQAVEGKLHQLVKQRLRILRGSSCCRVC